MATIDIILNKHNQMPLYLQIYQQLRQRILQGQLSPQSKLPATRRLAQQLDVARVTVTQAYDQLAAEGFVERRTGAGTFVIGSPALADYSEKTNNGSDATKRPFLPTLSDWGERIVARPPAPPVPAGRPEIDFGFGRSFPHIFPYDVWRRLLARYLSTDDVMLSRYGSVAGFFPLRQALADYLGHWRGVTCEPDQVVIVNGAQQALDILVRLFLQPGDEVLVETPGYADAFALFQAYGARLRALPVDENGFPVEQIPPDSRARLAFVTPSNQFPHGGSMPLARRLALLQWAQAHDAFLVEDDYDGELRYEGRPLAALQGLDEDGRVLYLGTFSKVLFPALRLSYIVLPPAWVQPFIQAKGLVDRGAPTLTQAAVSDFITEGHFERHLRHLRHAYGERRQVLAQALQTWLPGKVRYADVPAGLHVMLYLEPEQDETAVVAAAAQAGVGVYPGAPYHVEPDPPPSVLLGFSGLSAADIEEGVRRLATVL